MLFEMLQDLYEALRAGLKNLGVLLVAVRSLTLGISGNTVVLSVMNAALVPPYPEPKRIAQLLGQFSVGQFVYGHEFTICRHIEMGLTTLGLARRT